MEKEAFMYGPQAMVVITMTVTVTDTQLACGLFPLIQQLTMVELPYTMNHVHRLLHQLLAMVDQVILKLVSLLLIFMVNAH